MQKSMVFHDVPADGIQHKLFIYFFQSVTQFQRDAVIDEYTEQLIEEGLI